MIGEQVHARCMVDNNNIIIIIGEQVHARRMVDEPPRPSEDSCHFCYPQHQTGQAFSSLKNQMDCRTGRGGGLASSNP